MSKCWEKSTAVEKRHQGRVFEVEAVGRGQEMFRDAFFSTKVGFFEHKDIFSPPRQKNYVNRVLFFSFYRTLGEYILLLAKHQL